MAKFRLIPNAESYRRFPYAVDKLTFPKKTFLNRKTIYMKSVAQRLVDNEYGQNKFVVVGQKTGKSLKLFPAKVR